MTDNPNPPDKRTAPVQADADQAEAPLADGVDAARRDAAGQADAQPPDAEEQKAAQSSLPGILKKTSDFITDGKTVAAFIMLVLGGGAYVGWELAGKDVATKFVRETVRGDQQLSKDIVLNALLELDKASVTARKAALAEDPDQRTIILVDKNMADLVTTDIGVLSQQVADLETRIDDHAEQFSSTIDSWQSFELYRYFPSKRNAENEWEADTKSPAVAKLQHDIIAYPNDNLRLFFYAEAESAGGFRRINRQPLVGIKIAQKEARFPVARITGEDVAIHCYLRGEESTGIERATSSPNQPRLIRLGLLLEEADEDVEFNYKVFVVSKKQQPSEQECSG